MKKIECIIPTKKFADLEEKLRHYGISGLTVTEVKGYGNQQTRPDSYLLLPKTKVETYCRDEDVDDITTLVLQACKTGSMGDGKVAVFAVEDLIRVRTSERGQLAV